MSRWFGASHKQSALLLAVLVAAACATQTLEPTESVDPVVTGAGSGVGGDTVPGATGGTPANGGTDPMSAGGTGGTQTSSGGTGATGGATTGGTGATGGTGGRAAGTGGAAATGGTLGAAGKAAGGTGGTTSLFGGSAGTLAAAGKGGSTSSGMGGRATGGTGTIGAAGRGTGGTAAGGRSGGIGGAAGTATAGSAGMSTADCVTTLMPNIASGDLGMSAVCFDITDPTMMGWQVSNLGTRTLTVNGAKAPTAPAVPAADASGHRIFAFGPADGTTNQPTYTQWSYW